MLEISVLYFKIKMPPSMNTCAKMLHLSSNFLCTIFGQNFLGKKKEMKYWIFVHYEETEKKIQNFGTLNLF